MESLKRRVLKSRRIGAAKMPDKKERMKHRVVGIALIAALAFFFYRSFLALPFLVPVYLMYQREAATTLNYNRKRELAVQFKDAILSVSANQKAGYSVENAFKQSYGDMVLLYGSGSVICKEWSMIISGVGNGMAIEGLLYDFGKRSGVEEIEEFAEVFAAAKRNGGNLTQVIERSASVIEEKVETEKEIQVLISARKLEQKIMNVVPFGILVYINATSRGFFDVLYHNPAGVVIMSICLGIYIAAVCLSRRIVNIEV